MSFEPHADPIMISGKDKHNVSGFDPEQNPDFDAGAELENSGAEFVNAQTGVDVRLAHCFRQPANGSIYFSELPVGEILKRTKIGGTAKNIHGFHRFNLPSLRSFLISERILCSARFIS